MFLLTVLLAWQTLVVNEIHYAPDDPDLEFVEVHNRAPSTLPLHEWTLEDASGTRAGLAPRGVGLAPGRQLALVRDAAKFARRWPGVPYLELSPWPSLNDTGDEIRLSGPGGSESVPYAPSWGPRGRSLERRDPDGPGWHPVNWAPCTDPSGATPGRRNSTYAPDRQPPTLVAVDRAHPDTIVAWFSEPVLPRMVSLDGVVHATATAYPGASHWAVPVSSGLTVHTFAVEGLEDLFGNASPFLSAPVARAPGVGDIRISELLLRPVADPFDFLPDQVAFVELLSTAGDPVTLRATRLSGRPVETAPPPTTDAVSVPLVLRPGESAVILDARAAGATTRLDEAFGPVPPTRRHATPTWPLPRTHGVVRLLGSGGEELDRVHPLDSWTESPPDGVSLERYRFDTDGPASWGPATDPYGGSPGRVNSLAPFESVRPASRGDLVLSEILYAPADGQPEFIEWVVLADGPVDANGLTARFGGADSVRIAYGPTAWPPGSVIVASGSSVDEGIRRSTLESAFGIAGEYPVLPLRATLLNTGGTLSLWSGRGDSLDAAVWHDGLHHPGLQVSRGVSLERVDALGRGTEPSNWRSSIDPSGATPGRFRTAAVPGPDSGPWLVVPPVFHPDDGFERASVDLRTSRGPGLADVLVFDLTGRQVRTLADGHLLHDTLSVYWDGNDDSGRRLPGAPYVVLARIVDRSGHIHVARRALVLARSGTNPTEQPR